LGIDLLLATAATIQTDASYANKVPDAKLAISKQAAKQLFP